jgi:DNA segregation ATPase FtsK/SpoIIIE-like protein
VILGVNIGTRRRLMVWHIGHPMLPHGLVSGGTGVGKSGPLRSLAVHRLHFGHQVIMLEPGGLGENDWAEGVVSRVRTLAGARQAYATMRQELEHRAELLADSGASHYSAVGLAPVTLIGDEFPSLAGNEAASDDYELELVDGIISDAVEVARRGRKYGLHQVHVTQRPTVEATYRRAGGVMQANMPARIHLGDRDAESLKAAFRGSSGVKRSTLRALEAAELPGRALYARLDPADGKAVMAGQLWWITPDQAAGFAHRYEGPPPVDFDSIVKEYA